ncbi:MAG: hypothetical protein QNJ46_15965 [Leptolyngbyaceae cyanobacterium MO_188.B28]|nr:hypothetical protein [Leptolyngbyaceae cyanobacterium MO_188.B28]
MSSNKSSVPIARAIQSLRQELSQAIAEGEGKDLRFELGPVELEFQVEVSWEAGGTVGGEGGIKFGIVSLGEVSAEAEARRSRGTTHTIKLTLNPVTSEDGNVKVGDSNPTRPS